MTQESLKVGISDCLLGTSVRHDGSHRHSMLATDLLAHVVEFVAVCPEVEAGMGVPREPVELRASGEGTRMVGVDSGRDQTDRMSRFAVSRVEELAGADLRGYILKSGSPSCGLEVEERGANPKSAGPGIFARELSKRIPGLPVIEETDLAYPFRLQGFVERVFAYDRQMRFMSQPRSVGQLVMSHAQVKLQLDAHSSGAHEELAGLFSTASQISYEDLCRSYLIRFMEALSTPATPAGHFGVLKKVFSLLKESLEPTVQKELARGLQEYRLGAVPLSVPLTLLRHYARIREHPLLDGQTYLEPGPKELILRSHV